MYEPVIEREAAKRARVIFEHLQKVGPELLTQATTSTPAPELLVGSRERLARFAEAMISSGDPSRYKMLIEMARDTLVERWNRLLQVPQNIHQISRQEMADFAEFYTLVNSCLLWCHSFDLGLQVIKYNGPPNWVGYVTRGLIEAFYVSCQLDQLQIMNHLGALNVPLGRPAYEIYLGGRALATYAIARKRPQFVKEILQIYVKPLAPNRHKETLEPFLFWPFSGPLGLPEMINGRNEEYWQQRIEETWGDCFGTKQGFDAAAQLEFVLEINSHLLVQYVSPTTNKFREDFPEKRTGYIPDFWKNPLDPAVPIALHILESLVSTKGFPAEMAVEPDVTADVFKNMITREREFFYGQFLSNLKNWQDKAMMQQSRFPFYFAWPPQLQKVVDLYRASIEKRKSE